MSGVLSVGSVVSAISDTAQVASAAVPVLEAIANGTILTTDVPVIVQKLLQTIQPTQTPTSIPQATSLAAAALGLSSTSNSAPAPTDVLENVLTLILDGFTNSDIQAIGSKQLVLMSPSTRATEGINFESNIGKLLSQASFAGPVYLNVPQNLLNDTQINTEYVAYALQYLKATTNVNPAIVTWSQGSLDAQLAFKYWPSQTLSQIISQFRPIIMTTPKFPVNEAELFCYCEIL
ncbi:hypothetical protein G7Y89_g334 [Cudoniella acicularis]|uniref:Uncharacterized protein n=1 Tax=Cudoniella acicularis TaxID=354080 RepID=A0A8H4RY73_9HELO|nr:hypothetical protein G7Y89_g334 [Cudoniella acicularis]